MFIADLTGLVWILDTFLYGNAVFAVGAIIARRARRKKGCHIRESVKKKSGDSIPFGTESPLFLAGCPCCDSPFGFYQTGEMPAFGGVRSLFPKKSHVTCGIVGHSARFCREFFIIDGKADDLRDRRDRP